MIDDGYTKRRNTRPFHTSMDNYPMKLRIHYTLAGRDGSTDLEGNDTEAMREKFRKMYPGVIIRKIKVIRQ